MVKKIIFLSFIVSLASCSDSNAEVSKNTDQVGRPISLAISTDGKYVITTDANKHAYLYSLEDKKVKDLGDGYNPYSAYFVPNTDNYLLQKENKKVIISDINQKTIKEFTPDFIAKEQAINKDLTIWVGSITWGDVYKYSIPDMKKKQIYISWYMAKNDYNDYWRGNPPNNKIPNGTAIGGGFDFNFLNNILIATPNNSLVVYDFDKKKWNKVHKNVLNTMNAIDPNGQFVYTADSGLSGIKYNLNDGAKSNSALYYPDDNLENISYVQETKDRKKYFYNGLTNFKFIDKDKIIVTFNGKNQPYLWAFTFDTNKLDWSNNTKWKRPVFFSKNYLPLTKDPLKFVTGNYRDNTDPFPIVGGYNTTFDTSVEAHKLVMAQANGNGIMVYNYNPKDESLKLDWVGEPPKAEEKKEEKKGWFW